MEMFNIHKFMKIAKTPDIFRLAEFFLKYNKNFRFVINTLFSPEKRNDKYYFDKIIGPRYLKFMLTKKKKINIDKKHNYKADFIFNHLYPKTTPQPDPPRTRKILDFGCGDCTLGSSLSKLLPNSKCWGCDLQEWSEFADPDRKRTSLCEFTPISENQALPYEDDFFHIIVVSHVLHHIQPQNRDFVLRELHRVLSRDGLLVVLEHDSVDPTDKYIIELHHILYLYVSNPHIFSPKEQRKIKYYSDYFSMKQLQNTASRAGFDAVSRVFESKSADKLDLKILRQYMLILKKI